MTSLSKFHGIIPARYHSTRFPGKPLVNILDKPMFWHVYTRASQCQKLSTVLLATDDDRIFQAAEELGVRVVMTRSDHNSGTDRVLEAATALGVMDEDVVVNIQGDEPALEPAMLTELLEPFGRPDIQVTTLARKMDTQEANNPDRVKVVFSGDGRALYFSRATIPYPREARNVPFYCHIGLYAFRMKVLRRFSGLQPTPLEECEKLEQLRLLESGIPIHVAVTSHKSIGVDRPEDVAVVEKIIREQNNPLKS